ncbi:MAG TPA: helix-turn-helix transcriptional regulator [Bryobacteraceae bacterium]|jgi:transcriptional regulator with XRE-family HTH domain|nr:helix-turn-helix transcriptional regulator [Bryobacteraceae bacterium]
MMNDAGQRLKRARERLNLRFRDVEQASIRIAELRQNDDFAIALSRLSDIENKGTVPTIYRLYSLCAIYRLDIAEVLEWYGVDLAALPADAAALPLQSTHLLGFGPGMRGEFQVPLVVDPAIDLSKTTYLSRAIRRWGKLPLSLLNAVDLKHHRYAFIGTEDWSMYPILQPGALVLIDETQRKIAHAGWSSEFDRPIYFLEHRAGCVVGWCTLNGEQLVLQPHPASPCSPVVYAYPSEIDVIGQVSGVAMILDQGKRRRTRL